MDSIGRMDANNITQPMLLEITCLFQNNVCTLQKILNVLNAQFKIKAINYYLIKEVVA